MKDDDPVFFVSDNGMGIAREYHDSIFELFIKLNPEIEKSDTVLPVQC
jgi:light-regulated signal transduction histidine kinase (bacteriophytochrome)